MVFFEAFCVALIGIPIGVMAGIAGIGVTLMLIGNKFISLGMPIAMELSVSVNSIVIAIIVALITVLISAWIPSKRATKISAVEAIRQNRDIKANNKPVKTSKLTYRLFGLPGMLATKHYKRSKKKYRATIVSLFMSIVLFVSSSAFTDYLMEAAGGGLRTNGYDLYFAGREEDFNAKTIDEILALLASDKHVTRATYVENEYVQGDVHEKYLNEGILEEIVGGVAVEGDYGNLSAGKDYGNIVAYMNFVSDDEFKLLLKEYNLNENEFMNSDNPLAIAIDGSVVFDEIEYDQAGTYTYTITEGMMVWVA